MKPAWITAISTVIAILAGGILWLTNIHATASENSNQIYGMRTYQEKILDQLREMNQRLSRIEGKLE